MYHRAVRTLIEDRFSTVHGATARCDYPFFRTIGEAGDPRAALGYRPAGAGPLFLERYLDAPIETLVSGALHRTVERSRIVEIGALASHSPRATVALWAQAATALRETSEVAVAVLTAELRTMFARLGLPIVLLAPASATRMGPDLSRWGRYYDADPMVCAGEIATALPVLARMRPVSGEQGR